MKIIDLTKPIKYYPEDHRFMQVKIKHQSHRKSLNLLRLMGIGKKQLPDNFRGWADDKITKMGVHSTTHVDAPWHYGPVCGGARAKTIDEIPLERFCGPGVVIDMSCKPDMELITKEDLMQEIHTKDLPVKAGTVVLIKTGRDALIGTKEYMTSGIGMSREATQYLIDQGVKLMGIDQWGWDLPLQKTIDKIKQKVIPQDAFWEGHLVGIEQEYYHMEQVVGLDKLPDFGFQVIGMPLPLVGCSASPIRLIAIIDEAQ